MPGPKELTPFFLVPLTLPKVLSWQTSSAPSPTPVLEAVPATPLLRALGSYSSYTRPRVEVTPSFVSN